MLGCGGLKAQNFTFHMYELEMPEVSNKHALPIRTNIEPNKGQFNYYCWNNDLQ